MTMNFADTLKDTRERAGRTQEDTARLTNIDRRRVAHLESGDRPPTEEEVTRLIHEECLPPGVWAEARVVRRYKSSWNEKAQLFLRPTDFPMESRLSAARKVFGDVVGQRWEQVESRDDCLARIDFLRYAGADSGLEFHFLLGLTAEASDPCWLSPVRAGFRKYAVIHPKDREVMSDVRFPALEFEVEGFPAVLWPQLTLQVRHSVYRLDGLMGLQVGKKRVWVNVEIDGTGHYGTFDQEREERLGLLTVRLNTQEMRAANMTDLLGEKLRPLRLGKQSG